MKFNAPKTLTWLICLVLIVVGILAKFNIIPVAFIVANAFWFVAVGGVLLLLATMLKGL